jgi:hypothetical protein
MTRGTAESKAAAASGLLLSFFALLNNGGFRLKRKTNALQQQPTLTINSKFGAKVLQ